METDNIFLTEPSNYIIIQRRNNEISDVWKLEDAVVEYASEAEGWRIKTNKDALFFIQGDIEIWEVGSKDSPLWDMYKAYHAHSQEKTYRELFTIQPPQEEPEPEPKKGFFARIVNFFKK